MKLCQPRGGPPGDDRIFFPIVVLGLISLGV